MEKDKMKELEELAKPLNKWLQKNFNPHCRIIIEYYGAVVTQDEIGVPFEILD